ncbi:alpha/beta hydrolase [Streptomyces sp. NPDC048650]|uniref:alpha/beta hydrolase n=1 Tax=unclassified Streptomyces TaxID=2593676 RepID=UPI00371B2FD2
MTTGTTGLMGPGPGSGDSGGHRGAPGPLRLLTAPTAPRTAVLLLHGGRADSLAPPPRLHLPALRMRPFGSALARSLRADDPLLALVRYRHRGWNGARADAAQDAGQALDELAARAPGVPVVLVGHSMGGRAALRIGGHPAVRGIVALAPWCPEDEPVGHLRGRTLALLHDPCDRVTRAEDTWHFADRARMGGSRVHAIAMPSGGHAMLRGARHWHRLTTHLVTAVLDGTPPRIAPGRPAPGPRS